MMTQTVITNGQFWSFYAYQLNTICLSSDVDTKLKRNICWTTNEMKLFETIDDNDQVQGFNKDVLGQMIRFILNVPKENETINWTPYLRTDAQIPEEEWAALHKRFKVNYSNRKIPSRVAPRAQWELIYKQLFQDKVVSKK